MEMAWVNFLRLSHCHVHSYHSDGPTILPTVSNSVIASMMWSPYYFIPYHDHTSKNDDFNGLSKTGAIARFKSLLFDIVWFVWLSQNITFPASTRFQKIETRNSTGFILPILYFVCQYKAPWQVWPRPKNWTGFGQDLDWFWQVLTGFGQVLDRFKKKHGFGQVLDRIWTGFDQKSKTCPKNWTGFDGVPLVRGPNILRFLSYTLNRLKFTQASNFCPDSEIWNLGFSNELYLRCLDVLGNRLNSH